MSIMETAFAQLQQGLHQEALATLTQVIANEPENWNAMYLAGFCYQSDDQLPSAIRYFEMATQISQCEPFVWTALGIAWQLREDFPNSVAALKTSIKKNPSDFESRNSLGLTYKKMGEFRRANDSYEVAAQLLSDEAHRIAKDQGMTNVSDSSDGERTYAVESDYMEFVGNWLRHDGRYSIVMNNIGNAYLGLEDSENARDAFFESIEMTPPNTSWER